jgi:hypothetical protein
VEYFYICLKICGFAFRGLRILLCYGQAMKTALLTIYIAFCFSTSLLGQENIASDQRLNEMFCIASGHLKNGDRIHSMAPFYVVITVVDLKTNKSKEIATEYPSIESAINADSANAVADNQTRTFKFYSDRALALVDFFDFDIDKNRTCIDTITIDKLINDWNEDVTAFHNKYSGDCQQYFAFKLYKNGIMSTRGDWTSSISLFLDKDYQFYKRTILKGQEFACP